MSLKNQRYPQTLERSKVHGWPARLGSRLWSEMASLIDNGPYFKTQLIIALCSQIKLQRRESWFISLARVHSRIEEVLNFLFHRAYNYWMTKGLYYSNYFPCMSTSIIWVFSDCKTSYSNLTKKLVFKALLSKIVYNEYLKFKSSVYEHVKMMYSWL